ncbi:MAG: hypothetical protein ACFBSC_16390 [Microcoleaceae cyanobacterium]
MRTDRSFFDNDSQQEEVEPYRLQLHQVEVVLEQSFEQNFQLEELLSQSFQVLQQTRADLEDV